MRNIAVIPARSGSKGIKDKNIKLLNGKPLIAYTIEAAKRANVFEEIFVSTDSNQYAKIAREYGASTPFLRSATSASDQASSWEVVKETIENYRERGIEFDTVALLQPTSPLRGASDIINGYEIMSVKNANSVVSVCEVDHSPLWSNILPGDHSLVNFLRPELVRLPRQELPTHYRINGALYIVRSDYFMVSDNIYKEKSFAVIMSKENSIDIDDELDFRIAEALMK